MPEQPKNLMGETKMHDFTRRSLLQGGTALATAGALTGPALLEYAKAWAQAAPWQAEKGAKLTVMRWKRFVPAEDDAFNAMVAAFQKATGTEMNVFSESFEDVQPKASVAANTGSGIDLAWGLHTLPQLFPTKVIPMNDVADYLGKKYGGWTEAAEKTCKLGDKWLGIPVATVGGYMAYRKSATAKAGFKEFPKDFPGFLELCKALKANNTPRASRWVMPPATPTDGCTGCSGATMPGRSTRMTRSSSIRRKRRRRWNIARRCRTPSFPASHPGTTAPTTRRTWPVNSTAPPTASRSTLRQKTIRK